MDSKLFGSDPVSFPMLSSWVRWRGYLLGFGLAVVATALGEMLRPFLAPTNLVMIYLLGVIVTAIYGGFGPSIMVSVLSVFAFDFFLITPLFSFAVDDVQYLLTFLALLLVGFTVSYLTFRVRNLQVQERVEKLQNALLDSISHELRTPLVSVVGALSSLQEKDMELDEAARRNLIDLARDEADRLNRLVSNLLDVSRIEAGAMRLSLQPTDLADVVGATLEEANKRCKTSPSIKVEISPDLPLVSMDFALVSQVLNNLLDNAIKYSSPGSPVELKAGLDGGSIRIEISDRGIGIPRQELARIFDKFYRVHRPDMVTGTGLGLAICKGIIEAHGGRITAENRDGGGTTIRVLLPLAGSMRRNAR